MKDYRAILPPACRYTTGLLVLLLAAIPATAQINPKSANQGEVKVATRSATTISRAVTGSTRAARGTNGVLFVLTLPEDAEISINGKVEGKAVNGEFRRELPAGRTYSILVKAGPDYEPVKQEAVLKSGEPSVVKASLLSKYGLVRAGPALKNSTVFLDDKPVPPDRVEVDKDSNQLVIDGLLPGSRKVTIANPDYLTEEKIFTVGPGQEYTWTFLPEPAVVPLTVTTDVGAKVYVDGEEKGTTPANGVLSLPAIRLGTHEVKLVKGDYEEFKKTLSFEFGKPVKLEQKLTPLPTSAEFGDDFEVANLSRWTMPPSGWQIKSSHLFISNAPSVGYPTNYRYRDFVMHFHLKLTNSGGAAWALRVKDKDNYYLFYLSGPKGLYPNRFNTYVVQNGKIDPASPAASVHVIAPLKDGGEYDIDIVAKGNTFDTKITPAETGKPEPLDFFQDPNSVFNIGGIGFRTVGPEAFAINELFVQPPK